MRVRSFSFAKGLQARQIRIVKVKIKIKLQKTTTETAIFIATKHEKTNLAFRKLTHLLEITGEYSFKFKTHMKNT